MTTTQRAKFEFEAFIAGAQLPRRTVTFFAVDHTDQIGLLTEEHDRLPADDDGRVSSKSERAKIAKQIAALRDEMAASEQAIVIRCLTPDELTGLQDDKERDVCHQLAQQSVDPVLTADQWRAIGEVIGAGQWGALVGQANALVVGRVAVPDFSRSVSQTLSPPESSEN